MSGGFDDYEYQSSAPQRLPEIQAAVEELGADIVGLVDTFRWDELYTPVDISRLFGYEYSICINLNDNRLREKGHNNGLTLLSRTELLQVGAVSLGSRDAIKATVKLDGDEIDILLAYLDDLNEDVRLLQVQALSGYMDVSKPTVLMGDLNSLSSQDIAIIDEALSVFYRQNPDLEDDFKPVIGEMQRGEVVKELGSLGLIDSASSYEPTFPTKLFPSNNVHPFLRLDYCFYSPQLRVTNFEVPKKALFEVASDHLPIFFDVEIEHS